MMLRALLTCLLTLLPAIAYAQVPIIGPFSNCSGTVGGTAANIAFPSSGAGSTGAQSYIIIQNVSTGAQNIWLDALPNPTATVGSPSIEIVPTASYVFSTLSGPLPPVVSVIGSATGAAYTCWYK